MAGHNWEVTQVNELLYQMENFKGVMVGATNFMSNLDAAIMRRFTFKLQFDYLEDEGKRLFFERMFKTSLTAEDLDRLRRIPNLAPGGFRTVRQATYYLGGATTNAMRLTELEKEDRDRYIGFCRALAITPVAEAGGRVTTISKGVKSLYFIFCVSKKAYAQRLTFSTPSRSPLNRPADQGRTPTSQRVAAAEQRILRASRRVVRQEFDGRRMRPCAERRAVGGRVVHARNAGDTKDVPDA